MIKKIVKWEKMENGKVEGWRVVEKDSGCNNLMNMQKMVNAFNFPFTMTVGHGCFYGCSYCFLREKFWQRFIDEKPGKEMNYKKGIIGNLVEFLRENKNLPQYMKRIQIGITSEMYHPKMVEYVKPRSILKMFKVFGKEWMIHLVTKSNMILEDIDLLEEMKDQVQVEVSLSTLDKEGYRLFERGTPNPKSRLKIVEELSKRGIFVRVMCMPVLRRYKMVRNGKGILPIYRNEEEGREVGMYKSGQENLNGGVKYYYKEKRKKIFVENIGEWKPVILHDYSQPEEMKKVVYDLGARAFKSKDLNYYYVDELLAADREGRDLKKQRGRFEDPDVEILEKSGEEVLGEEGNVMEVEVRDFYRGKKEGWASAPRRKRRKMNFGYREISNIDWIDCV